MSDLAVLATDAQLTGVAGWAVNLMEQLGGIGAGIAIAAENLFPPLPSEIILPLAGFTASRGNMSLFSALFWTTAGSVIGAIVLYYIGVALGRDRLRAIVDKMPLVKLSDVDKAEAWFARNGHKAVFFGRMIPIFRSLISIPAGIEKMHVGKFLLLTLSGSAIWNTIFVMSGYYLGENWHLVEGYAGILQWIVIAVVGLLLAWWVINRVRSMVKVRRAGGVDNPPTESDLATDPEHHTP